MVRHHEALAMPTFVFTSPDGKTHEVNGPEGSTEAQAFGVLQTRLKAREEQAAKDKETYAPDKDMGAGEKFAVGAGAAFNRLAGGVAGLIPGAEDFAKSQNEDYELYKKHHPGGWATAGEVVGDIAATAPLGGALGVASRALPAAGRLAAVGGRFVNPGTAGRAAIEAGTVGGLVSRRYSPDAGVGHVIFWVLAWGAVGVAGGLALRFSRRS